MSMQDPVADMLTRIRNGQMANKSSVAMPSSKLKVAIAQVLKDEGYIGSYNIESHESKPSLTLDLRYYAGKPVIESIKRISSPSLKRYFSASDLPKIKGGLGIAIVSTSQGLMTDRRARKLGIGGELLCTVE